MTPQILREFLDCWPLDRIKNMTLSEYSQAGSKDAFTFWLESRTENLGSIWGGSAFKFGIYHRKNQVEKETREGYRYEGEYAWADRFGSTAEEAFLKVKSEIIRIIEGIQAGHADEVDDVDLGPAYKWKIAFLYQDRESPRVAMLYKKEAVLFLAFGNQRDKRPLSQAHAELVSKWDPNKSIEENSIVQWKAWAVAVAETPIDDEEVIPSESGAYWLLGAMWGEEDMHDIFVKEGRWENGYEEAYLEKVRAVRPGDIVAIKSSFVKRNRDSLPFDNHGVRTGCMKIKARGVVLENPGDGRNLRVRWHRGLKPFEIYSWVWQPTINLIDQVKYKNAIEWIWKDVPQDLSMLEGIARRKAGIPADEGIVEETFVPPVDEPVDRSRLIHSAVNLVLYGPPGTGKTYATRAKALELLGEVIDDDRQILVDQYEVLSKEGRILFTTFHPSLAYEEFVEGLRPVVDSESGQIRYEVKDGIFVEFCNKAKSAWAAWCDGTEAVSFDDCWKRFVKDVESGDGVSVSTTRGEFKVYEVDEGTIRFHKQNGASQHTLSASTLRGVFEKTRTIAGGLSTYYNALAEHLHGPIPTEPSVIRERPEEFVLVIDEINRANLSKVFGELITLLEPSKRLNQSEALTVVLPYSRDPFGIPPNLHILATMNTADRSIAAMDLALRRRFTFEECLPLPRVIAPPEVDGVNLPQLLSRINERIEFLLDAEHCIGHSMLIGIGDLDGLRSVFQRSIIPLLKEYFFEDWGRVAAVLSGPDGKSAFFTSRKVEASTLFGVAIRSEGWEARAKFELTDPALWTSEAFSRIYSEMSKG